MRKLSAEVIGMLMVAVVPFLAASAAEPIGDQKLVEKWMPGLAGSFRIEGSVELPGESELLKRVSIVGKADCRRIGEGAGLHCTFDELQHVASANGAGDVGARARIWSNGLPTRMLLGIDPVARKIRVMVMDGSAGLDATGSLSGNTVAFKGRCDLAGTKRA